MLESYLQSKIKTSQILYFSSNWTYQLFHLAAMSELKTHQQSDRAIYVLI